MSSDDTDTPARELSNFGRRDFLRTVAAGGAAAVAASTGLPGCGSSSGPTRRYLSESQRTTLEALAEALIPEDETVGALGAGAVEYVDRWLAAFDHPLPQLFRGGPYSGRVPYPDPKTGDASNVFPANHFHDVLEPTRLQEAAFRIEFFGSDAVPNGNINDGAVPTTPGWLALYHDGLAQLETLAQQEGLASYADGTPEQRLDFFDRTPKLFRDAVLDHLCEGLFCAPEYGGNRDQIAWRQYHYDGDSQPLGHTLFDPATGESRDRPDQPCQTLDPNLPNDGFERDIVTVLTIVTLAQGGKRFY
ncbi:MAG: gluconate 2-dehydrogenase subunit 3 family protein [Deltaproteobacteria bacterium]|nr:gluconate 2-dehydrogenase subunit 3 family protein [Deltaproteobacteria bacterium]